MRQRQTVLLMPSALGVRWATILQKTFSHQVLVKLPAGSSRAKRVLHQRGRAALRGTGLKYSHADRNRFQTIPAEAQKLPPAVFTCATRSRRSELLPRAEAPFQGPHAFGKLQTQGDIGHGGSNPLQSQAVTETLYSACRLRSLALCGEATPRPIRVGLQGIPNLSRVVSCKDWSFLIATLLEQKGKGYRVPEVLTTS